MSDYMLHAVRSLYAYADLGTGGGQRGQAPPQFFLQICFLLCVELVFVYFNCLTAEYSFKIYEVIIMK